MEGPSRAKVTESRGFSTYAQTCIRTRTHSQVQRYAFADVDRDSTCLRVCVALFAPLYTESGALDQRRGTVIQRTGGQGRQRKSLILNGARTDIARENWK